MSNDDWNHRSQFKGPKDPDVRTITAAVNTRRYGEVEQYVPTRQEIGDAAEDGLTEDEEAQQRGYADKWEMRFAHLPGISPDTDTDDD